MPDPLQAWRGYPERRYCMNRGQPCGHTAAFVVKELDGCEWFACPEHAAGALFSTPIVEWFKAADLVPPSTTDD